MAKNSKVTRSDALKEIGVAGEPNTFGQFNASDFLPQLRGNRAIRAYREMRDNDAIIGAYMTAVEMMLRSVKWRVEPADDTPEAYKEREFVESVLDDMSHTFEDLISEVVTFLPYGFSFHEVVYKVRGGPETEDPSKRSKYSDGRIGIRKIAPRAQWTLLQWDIDEYGGIKGFIQDDGYKGAYIPIEKGLLFRTTTVNNAPSGRSVLRNAYKSWYYQNNMQEMEAIAIEREWNGLPVGRVPGEYLSANATDEQRAIVNQMKTILRDVKLNEQGYILLPSDMWEDSEGKTINQRMIDVELMSGGGSRSIDVGSVIVRYQQDMARTVLADFIMLGSSDRGSFALSKSKTDLFLQALNGYMDTIESVLNRYLLPRLWQLNGLNFDTMPKLVHGDVAPVDLGELGAFIRDIAGAGAPLFPDIETENALRTYASLPEREEDLIEQMGVPDTPEDGE